MEHNFDELFFDGSVLVDRFELTDGLISHIQLFYEMFIDDNNIGEDIEVLLPCILLVLQIHGFEIDFRSDVFFMASIFFDEAEMFERQMNIYDNYDKLFRYHLNYRW